MSGAIETCAADFRGRGEVELSERGEPQASGWTTTALVESADEEVTLGLYYEPGSADGLQISLHSYHVENEETKRAFHAGLKLRLNHRAVRQLRAFLDCVIALERE